MKLKRKQLSESLKLLNKFFIFLRETKSHQNQFHKRVSQHITKKEKKKIVN